MHDQQLNVTVCNKGFTLQLTQNCSNVIKWKKRNETREKKRKQKQIAFVRAYSQSESYQSFVYSFHTNHVYQKWFRLFCFFFRALPFENPNRQTIVFDYRNVNKLFTFPLPKTTCINCTTRKHEKVIESEGIETVHTWWMGKWHYDGDQMYRTQFKC